MVSKDTWASKVSKVSRYTSVSKVSKAPVDPKDSAASVGPIDPEASKVSTASKASAASPAMGRRPKATGRSLDTFDSRLARGLQGSLGVLGRPLAGGRSGVLG